MSPYLSSVPVPDGCKKPFSELNKCLKRRKDAEKCSMEDQQVAECIGKKMPNRPRVCQDELRDFEVCWNSFVIFPLGYSPLLGLISPQTLEYTPVSVS